MGMTQLQLADCIGIRFQQIQKYENAKNRVSASRLFEIAAAQAVEVSYYFDGLPEPRTESYLGSRGSGDVCMDREGAEFVRFVSKIPLERRRRLVELAQQIAG